MTSIVGLWAALLAALASVQTLDVVPVLDRTEVRIGIAGPVVAKDFALSEPDRIVIDFEGATNEFARSRFANISRGGVRAIRLSQFRRDVVRVVIDLEGPVDYSIERGEEMVRVSFPNPAGPFDAWSTGAAGPLVQMANRGPAPAPDDLPIRPAPAPDRARPAPAERRAAEITRQQQEQPRITIYFGDMPIRDVLATFAEFSDRSIVPGPDVTGQITADIRNQQWDVALEAILSAHGFAARELEGGIIRVDAVQQLQQLQQAERLVTRTVPIRYTSVDSILPAVRQVVCDMSDSASPSDSAAPTSDELAFLAFRSGGGGGDQCRGGVASNRSTNALIVTAGESAMPGIQETIRELDVRTPQVTINAKIIFVDRSRLEGLGITYDLKDSQGSQLNTVVSGIADLNGDGVLDDSERNLTQDVISLGGASIAGLANATSQLASPTLQLVSTLVLNRHSLIAFINALESRQFTEVQAHPALRTLDHRSARVQVGEETPVRVVDAGGAAGGGQEGGSFPRATVQFRETGIILEVTPHVTGDQVMLELHAERSNVGLAPSDVGVVFNTQETQTQVLVDDGATVVISGLTLIEKSEVRSGIPLLMNLPLIGGLFRNTQEEESKQDLLIMVTPHIVREGEA